MKTRLAFILALLFLGIPACLPLEAKDLMAGVARVEIRPPLGISMAGFGARNGNSDGVLDYPQAKVLVLEGKERAAALVTLDLVGVFPEDQLDSIRTRVAKSCGIADVIFNCSHTHSGPTVEAQNPLAWQKAAVEEIGAAIERAWGSRMPAGIGIGQGSVFIGHNRLYFMADGTGKMLWRNETRIRTSPVDPTLMLLRIDRLDGTPLAIVVNYACHPVVLGPSNLKYSADYPGEMMRLVESSLPGNPACMFLQGAAGDINPYYDKTPVSENAIELMRETGRSLGTEVLRVAKATATKPAPDSEIRIARETLQIQGRWNKEKFLARYPNVAASDAMKLRIERMFRGSYQAPVTVMLVNRDFAFVGVPAEIFVDYQIELRERVRDFPVLFGGYTNANLAYVPTIKGAVDGGYGASETGAILEVGAGDRMIDRAVIQLGYWTGKLKSTPETPKQ